MLHLPTAARGRCALLAVSGLLLAGAAVPASAPAAGSDAPAFYTCGHLGMTCPDESGERARERRRAARAKARQARRSAKKSSARRA